MQLIPSPRVLIVDDDPALAHMIEVLLKDRWFDCVVRRSGAQAIDAFTHDDFDLIITDLNMAAGDGVTLVETIRRTSQTPVIIVTGFERQYTERMRSLGNIAVIRKPFDFDELLDTIEAALQAGDTGPWKGRNIATLNRAWVESR